jgi:hypothetical protein
MATNDVEQQDCHRRHPHRLDISIASFVGQVEGNAKTTQGLRLAVDANRIAQEPDVTADGMYQLKIHKWCARNPVGTSSQYS